MQVSRGCRDVGVAEQALNDVKVHPTADEARGIAVAPAGGEVATGHTRRSPGLHHQAVQCLRPQPCGYARSMASRRSVSDRCKYRLVVAMLEWPISRWTTWMSSPRDRKSTRLNSSHLSISYAVFCLKK